MLSGKQPQTRQLSPSQEHYLRSIWEVRTRQGYARLTDDLVMAERVRMSEQRTTKGATSSS